MKNINILFFGKLKESWQSAQFNWQSNAQNIEKLYAELLEQSISTPHKDSIKVAINDEFMTWESSFKDGDVIAFLPPVSGG